MGILSDIREKLFRRKRAPLVSERIPSAAYDELPPAIAAKLKASASRVKRIVAIRGMFATLAVFVIALLLVMAIDAMVVIFSPYVRWGLWSAIVGATLVTAYKTIRVPLSRPFTPARIASLIEQNHPELEERLSTVVELIGMGEGTAASKRLMEVLTEDAVSDANKVSPRKEFSTRTVKPRLLAAVVALAIVGVLVAAFPRAMGRLLTRAIVPSAEVDNIYASSLTVTPGDAVLLEGTPLTVQLAVKAGFPSKAYIRTRRKGEGETVERMVQASADTRRGDSTFYTFRYPQVAESFTYRINCGSALTRGYSVKAVPVPAYSGLSVRLAYPEYTRREPDVITNAAPSQISTLSGTDVEISAMPLRPDIKATLLLPRGQTLSPEEGSDGRFRFAFRLDDKLQGQWGILLVDQYGFSNRVEYAGLSVAKDAVPTIRFVSPEQSDFELPLFGQIPFEYRATDDFGFDYARVEMTDENGRFVKAFDLSPEETSPGVWTGTDAIELAKFSFGNRPFARFRLAVSDTLPAEYGGPHVAYSREITVNFVRNALSLEGKQLADQVKGVRKTVDDVVRMLESAKHLSGDAGNFFIKPPESWEYALRWKKLDDGKKNLLGAENLMSELCSNMEGSLLEKPGESLKQVLDEHIVPARRYCEDIYMIESDDEKSGRCKTLVDKIADAIAALRQARKDFDREAKAALELQKLADFAEREEELAEMAKVGEIDPELWADRQEDLTKEFEKTFDSKLNDPLAREEDRVNALRERGDELKKRQEELAKEAAALKGDDEAAREEAEKDLSKKGKRRQMPADSKPEDIVAALESELAKDIEDFAVKTDQFAERLKHSEDAQAAKEAQDSQRGQEAQRDGQQAKDTDANEAGEEPASQQVDKASDAMHDAAKTAQDASESMKKGDDVQAQQDMKDVQDKLDEAGAKLDKAMDALEKRSDEMRGGNTEQFEEAHEQMLEASKEAREAAENYAKAQAEAQRQGDPQEGELEQGVQQQEQQQGESEQGAQQQELQQGESEQGAQQQGWQQQGEQQQGELQGVEQQQGQQQGAQQQGEPPQALQQDQGEQQKGPGQLNAEQAAKDAMQKAAQAAKQAAQQIQQAARNKAKQMGMSQKQMMQLQRQMQMERGMQGPGKRGGMSNGKQQNRNSREGEKRGRKNWLRNGIDGLLDGGDADWFKNLSRLESTEIEDALQSVPPEYRGLVREYFSELSKEAKK